MGDHNLTASSAATSSTAPTAATRGHCIQARVLGQPCHFDVDCSPGMVCSVPDYLCDCAMGLRYSRQRARCEADPGRHHDPWTLDLPPIADMDAEVVETIPATYDCPLLVGMISVVLVLICLVVAAYCRFTDPPPKPPGYRPARTEREEGEPFEWGSESSPLRSSWGGESDLSSLRRVKQCSCDLAQASAQAAAAAAAQPPDPPTPDGPRPVPPPRVPTYAGLRSPESPVDVLGAHMDPLGLRRTLPSQVQLPPTPSLRGSVRVYMPQLPAGVVRAGR
ncbi:hypothetical protein ONE63_004254 [Megalurothrips usitatus]|uniref:EB domain-containing protein n=1 Tax=Megalurothrips usitatus TaxID=439358 RepID=A0AAV7X5L3_9NEOP|nr:hypothetical protein ONE63_004254 [Megalurothrips usitatus]